MAEKPRIIISSTRRREIEEHFFPFSEDHIRKGNLYDLRKQAYLAYNHLPIPSPAEEAWRRSDIRSLPVESLFFHNRETSEKKRSLQNSNRISPQSRNLGGRVTITQKGCSTFLTPDYQNQGVLFTDLQTAEKDHPEILQTYLGKIIAPEAGKFAALTTAFSQNGIFLYIPKGVKVSTPLTGLLLGDEANSMLLSHLVIWVDEGASARFILEAKSIKSKQPSLLATNIEIIVSPNASLQIVDLSSHDQNNWNFNHARAQVGQNATIDWVYGVIGGKFSKSFMDVDLIGTGAQGSLSGFYFTDGTQHLDIDTQQNHLAANTTSNLLFKGVLKGHSRAIWQGMIYVAPGAIGTDGYQANRNIVLNEDARADSIPGLEILADDVRCSHGATVSMLENEPIFYLQSRGIPRMDVEHLLIQGFFEPIIEQIKFPYFRYKYSKMIDKLIK